MNMTVWREFAGALDFPRVLRCTSAGDLLCDLLISSKLIW